MASCAARSVMRSAAARLSAGVKPRSGSSPFRISAQKPLSARIFRSPVEMSSVNVASMLPFHSATASALLTSMLSVSPRSHAWTLEVHFVILPWMTFCQGFFYFLVEAQYPLK